MKKILYPLAFAMLLSCGKDGGGGGSGESKTRTPSTSSECDITSEAKLYGSTFKTNSDISLASTDEIICMTPSTPTINTEVRLEANYTLNGFDSAQAEKAKEAIGKLLIVVNSEEFKQKILNFEFEGIKQFKDNSGLTNAEIYDTLMNGAEKLLPEEDHAMDLSLNVYFTEENVVGYTYPNSLDIFMNERYLDKYTVSGVAKNIIHEWTHKLGFHHDFDPTYGREYSVPYGIGYLVRDMVDSL